jgi:hypothetical protein
MLLPLPSQYCCASGSAWWGGQFQSAVQVVELPAPASAPSWEEDGGKEGEEGGGRSAMIAQPSQAATILTVAEAFPRIARFCWRMNEANSGTRAIIPAGPTRMTSSAPASPPLPPPPTLKSVSRTASAMSAPAKTGAEEEDEEAREERGEEEKEEEENEEEELVLPAHTSLEQ